MKISTSKLRGFTLIELLVVIGIIALLTAIILPSLAGSKGKARDAQRVSDLAQLQLALELFYDRCGYYPPPVSSGSQYIINASYVCTTPNGSVTMSTYISQIPTPPAGAGQSAYDYTVLNNSSSQAVSYVLHAKLESTNAAVAKGLNAATITAIIVPSGGGWSPVVSATPYTNCSSGSASVDYCIGPQ